MKAIFKSIILSGLFLGGLPFFISLTGCASAPGLMETYPDFIERKENVSSISLCTDVLIFFDGVEEGVVVDIPLSQAVGDSILSIFKRGLEQKNFPIGEVYPTAVGYSLGGDEKHYKVFETAADYSAKTSSLKRIPAPFVLNDEFLEVDDFFNGVQNEVSSDDSTEQLRGGEYLLYCYVDATNVSLSKQIGESFLTSLLSFGESSSHPISGANISYQLYDLRSGVIVLSDGRIMEDKDLDAGNIINPLEDMLEEIPAKGIGK